MSGREPSVNKSFGLLLQLLKGRQLVSRISRELASWKSPMLKFRDFSFIVLSSTTLQAVENFTM